MHRSRLLVPALAVMLIVLAGHAASPVLAALPTVTGVSPNSGSLAGGTLVTITGTSFSATPGATSVFFGSFTSAAAGVTCSSNTSCTAFAPPHLAGTIDVTVVVNGSGQSNPVNADRFTYVAGPVADAAQEYSSGISANSNMWGITAGPDGNLWFAENYGNQIGRITPNGVVTEFGAGITANSGPVGITAGPDGNLWFTENSGNRIGRITPSGVVTEFSSGITPSSALWGITAGPDGNLWFTENSGNRIGRITPSGVVTEFSAGISPASFPYGITAGPDGNVWFTENGNTRVGRITPAGVVSEFSAGITANPYGIAAGPDGNLWFAEYYGNRVGRVTPNGAVTEFTISSGSYPPSITAGPDGNLWFSEAGGRIGRISTAGVVSEFSAGISAGSEPNGITAGPDGALWFTESLGNSIGRTQATVTGVSPTSGPAGGSTPVTISGYGFSGATSVRFGGTPTFFSISSDTQINAQAPAGSGTVDVSVSVGQAGSLTGAADRFTYTAPVCAGAGLVPSLGSPQPSGTSVTFFATTSVCSGPQYQFWLLPPGGSWSVQQPFSTTPNWTWSTTGLAAGTYYVNVWVKNSGSAAAYESYAVQAYALTAATPCSAAALDAAPTSPEPPGTAVSFLALSSGCTSPRYRFWLLPPGGSWSVQQDYSAAATWQWSTTGLAPGTYYVVLWVRQAGSSAAYDAYAYQPYALQASGACTSALVSASPPSPQVHGVSITLTAQGYGCGSPHYRFWLLPPGGNWTMVQDYSATASYAWNTSGAVTGAWTVSVWVEQSTNPNSYDTYAALSFTLN